MGQAALIGVDAAAADSICAAYRAAMGDCRDPLMGPFDSTCLDPAFPGGLFAWPRGAGEAPVFYAASQTHAQWRRLRPLLLAFVGPSLTDFSGSQTPLDPTRPHERVLAEAGMAALVRLTPTAETAESATRALRRLVDMVGRTPPDAEPPPEATGRLLARIRDHLNAAAIADARQLLERCRSEHRLDALNLKFLEIEILAASRDWRAIAALSGFDDVLQTRRPPAVTAALLEAVYWAAFDDAAPDVAAYAAGPRLRARNLVRLPAPPSLQDGAWRLYALEAISCAPPNPMLAQAALTSGADLGGLADQLAPLVATNPLPEPPPPPSVAETALAVITADLSGTLSTVGPAMARLNRQTEAERGELDASYQLRAASASIRMAFGAEPPPADWTAWLTALSDPGFIAAARVANQGAQEWQPGFDDPSQVKDLAAALNSCPDEFPASDRLLEGLPHLVAWLQRDPDFPRAVGFPVYEAALFRLVLSGRAAVPMLDSAGVLTRAILAIGPSSAAYAQLLSDLLDFSGQGAGVRTAYWLMELIEETVAAQAPDQAARERFWQDAIGRLIPVWPQLTELQRASLRRLATFLGLAEALPVARPPGQDAGGRTALAGRLAGKMVAVYTLTASAAAQASDTLKALAPDVDVRVNGDFAGSRPLRALAENADLFVVVACSATHAATDFIRMRRGDRALAYAAGRGATSILRAVENWALGPSLDPAPE